MAKKEKKDSGLLETVKTVVYALLIAGIFRTVFFQPFWIPSGSMKDTLLIGDFVFVNKMVYGYSYASCPSIRAFGLDIDAKDICGFLDGDNKRFLGGEPERGDVIVFRHPVTGADYVKRLIGLPGDTVQIRDGRVHLNGKPLEVKDAGVFEEIAEAQGPLGNRPRCENGPVGTGGVCQKSRQIETLPNGVSHAILNITDQQSDHTGVYTAPAGHYFFMGDNRDNSTDSRVPQAVGGVGFVPLENLIGRADRIMFSSAGKSLFSVWAWRGDRFFLGVE